MAHVQKFTRGSATRIIEHCERVKSKEGKYRKYRTGSEIDDTRTGENYPFRLKGVSSNDGKSRLDEILTNTHCMNRQDVNVMADWVITLPKDYEGDEKKFFKECSAFVVNRYGKDSFIGGFVHKDETTPHIHLCFVPRVYDEKKERYKVSAKEVLNKKELRSFHPDLEKHLQEKGLVKEGQILNGITQETGGNKTIPELKKLQEEAEQLKEELNEFKGRAAEWQKAVDTRVEEVEGLLKKLDGFVPKSDLKEISRILEDIKGKGLENCFADPVEQGPELNFRPVKRKEKVR